MSATFGRFAAALALGFAASALAEPIQVNNVGLEIAEARYSLYADFHLELTPPLLEALKNGVSLGFLVEFELTRPRWRNSTGFPAGRCIRISRRSPRRFKRSARFTAGRCWDRIRSTTAENTSLRCACAWTRPNCRRRSA